MVVAVAQMTINCGCGGGCRCVVLIGMVRLDRCCCGESNCGCVVVIGAESGID